jgi:hypothetical protein
LRWDDPSTNGDYLRQGANLQAELSTVVHALMGRRGPLPGARRDDAKKNGATLKAETIDR